MRSITSFATCCNIIWGNASTSFICAASGNDVELTLKWCCVCHANDVVPYGTNEKIQLLRVGFFGGGWWIRTTEVSDNRFTVCPLWPLGKSPILWVTFVTLWSWWSESNQQPADYKSAALPLSHTSELFVRELYSLSQREYYITTLYVCQPLFEKYFYFFFFTSFYTRIIPWQIHFSML